MKKLAVHKDWVTKCSITESFDEKKEGYSQSSVSYRRFTATILGYQNWKIFEGYMYDGLTKQIIEVVEAIKIRILKGDTEIFKEKGYVLKEYFKDSKVTTGEYFQRF